MNKRIAIATVAAAVALGACAAPAATPAPTPAPTPTPQVIVREVPGPTKVTWSRECMAYIVALETVDSARITAYEALRQYLVDGTGDGDKQSALIADINAQNDRLPALQDACLASLDDGGDIGV